MENLNGLNTFPSECNENKKLQAKIARANRKMALAIKRTRESSTSSRRSPAIIVGKRIFAK